MNAQMRKHALRQYIVFRMKVIEYFDIGALRQGVSSQQLAVPSPVGRTPPDFVAALRTVQLSWFALLVDKSKDGMDAIKLWSELFPKHSAQIQDVWARIEPSWKIIRTFRDKSGFHADKPSAFFRARIAVHEREKEVNAAIAEFEHLLRIILKAEADELPDLEQAVDELLNELEIRGRPAYKKAEFKRYLMLPNTTRLQTTSNH